MWQRRRERKIRNEIKKKEAKERKEGKEKKREDRNVGKQKKKERKEGRRKIGEKKGKRLESLRIPELTPYHASTSQT